MLLVCFAAAVLAWSCTGAQGARWEPPAPAAPTKIELALDSGHSVEARVIATDIRADDPFFFTPDGLELIAHTFWAGCRRAVAFDASGTRPLQRRVGECYERWIAALDDSRGLVVDRSGSLEVKRFGSAKGEPWPHGRPQVQALPAELPRPNGADIGSWAPIDDRAGLLVAASSLYWVDSQGALLLRDDVSSVAATDTPTARAALRLNDGRLVAVELDPIVAARKRAALRWSERVAWLSDSARDGRLSGGPHDEAVVSWLSEEFRKAGSSPERQSFEVMMVADHNLEVLADGEKLAGVVALPMVDEIRVDGQAMRVEDISSSDGNSIAIAPLPNRWQTLVQAFKSMEQPPAVLFLETEDAALLEGKKLGGLLNNAIPGDGAALLVAPPEATSRLEKAKRVRVTYTPDVRPRKTASVIARVAAQRTSSNPERRAAIVVTAHWDHVGRGGFGSLDTFDTVEFPGANDNASGVASLLHLAQRVASNPLRQYDVVFVATAAEEQGLLGVRTWVRSHTGAPPVLTINFDMMGTLDAARFFVSDNLPETWVDLLDREAKAIGWPLQELSPLEEGGASDHLVIHDSLGTPALFVHAMDESTWHTSDDRAGSLDPDAAICATHLMEAWLRAIDAQR